MQSVYKKWKIVVRKVCVFYALVLLMPLSLVYAGDGIVISLRDVGEDHEIRAARGGEYNSAVIIKNTSNEEIGLTIYFADQEGKTVASGAQDGVATRVIFYDIATLDEASQKILQENKNDIVTFCSKKNDFKERIEWCEGRREVQVRLMGGEVKTMPITMGIDDMEEDHEFFVIATTGNERQEIAQEKFTYRVPDRNITQIDLQSFSLENIFDHSIKNLLKGAFSTSQPFRGVLRATNSGTEKAHVEYYIKMDPVWFGEIDRVGSVKDIKMGESQDVELEVHVPYVGLIEVVGGVQYATNAGEIKYATSEPIKIFVWPMQWVVRIFVGICFCTICVLLYKYINKHMFNFRKNKKADAVFTGKYIVQDTDNIISIAQKFNVPWKELASVNKIDAPYILIKGEAIMVPAGVTEKSPVQQSDAVTFLVQKANEDNEIDHVRVQDVAHDKETLIVEPVDVSEHAFVKTHAQERVIGQEQYAGIGGNVQTSMHDAGQDQQKIDQQTPVARKSITFASPQSMLTQPASDPTTRVIDIEWMRDDEEAYLEEMHIQQKKVNKHLIIGILLAVVLLGVAAWFGVSYMIARNKEKVVPVEKLISEDTQKKTALSDSVPVVEQENSMTVVITANAVDVDDTETVVKEKSEKEEGNIAVNPSDVAIQILNAGGETGAAGSLTKLFKDKGYKTLSAQNAQNDHANVTIYHVQKLADHIKEIETIIPEKYGSHAQEVSEEMTKKYNADIVIVLGEKK